MGASQHTLYERKQNYLSEQLKKGNISDEDEALIRHLAYAFDEEHPEVNLPDWPDAQKRLTKHRSKNTLANWIYFLTRMAQEIELASSSKDDVNTLMGEWLRGNGDVKDDGLTKGTLRAYQNTARIFYRYHDFLDVDYDAIQVYEMQDTSVSPQDMLISDEMSAVRQAPDNTRDEAVVYLLMYTGLRNTALRKTKIKHLDLGENDYYYFNKEADGLKDISRIEQPRPLLGAAGAVRRWLNHHPTGEDDHYLITAKFEARANPTEPVAKSTIERIMDKVKEKTGIEKPLHPHMMRHNFVSVCKREYGLDDSTVKFYIGHSEDSNVMSTTYSHLSGEDYAKKGQIAAGYRDAEEAKSSLSPEETCGVCHEPVLSTDQRACHNCGNDFTPDSKSVKEDTNEAINNDLVVVNKQEVREALRDMGKDWESASPETIKAVSKMIEQQKD